MSSVTPPPDTHFNALKRRIFALEEENTRLLNKVVKKPVHSYLREGRAIRRLVNLTEPITDLVEEFDRRLLEVDNEDEMEHVAANPRQQRNFASYKQLIRWCPSVARLMQGAHADETEMAFICQELKQGADSARGDDANLLKRSVALWLNERTPPPSPLVAADDKQRRGFNHELTGALICPVDYNWLDPSIRDALKTDNPYYPVTVHAWPAFMYAKGQYNPQRPTKGLFRGDLLVRAFRCVFTSPSSAREVVENVEGTCQIHARPRRPCRVVRPRCDVAGLLKMRSVEPRAIAYIALRFALSSATSWDPMDNLFDYGKFYDNMIKWFAKQRNDPMKAQALEELLQWWNCMIFGAQHNSIEEPVNAASMSVAVSME